MISRIKRLHASPWSAFILFYHHRSKAKYGKLIKKSSREESSMRNSTLKRSNLDKDAANKSYDEEISLDNDNFLNSLESSNFPHTYTGIQMEPPYAPKNSKF
ncbi:unnamed protein product [Gordionus sp. m RMFG-2023]